MIRRLLSLPLLTAAALSVACQAVVPGQAPPVRTDSVVQAGGPTFVLTPERREGAIARLAGRQVSDWVNSQVGAASRWQKLAPPAPAPADRSLMALGAPAGAAWNNGIDIRQAPFNCLLDFATNGFASRNAGGTLPKRVFMITRNGVFLDMDPDDPTNGFCKTVLLGETFTKTFVTLSGNGAVAFVVSDNGRVFAIDVTGQNAGAPPTRTVRSLYLSGSPVVKAVGTALFADPLASDFGGSATTLYACDNGGGGHQIQFTPAGPGLMSPAQFMASAFSETATVPLSVATPVSGLARIASPPVVLGGKLVVGDRGGNLITYDWNAGGTPVRKVVNYGWPIETPVAVDTDDALNPTDYFAAAGAQLVWLKADGTLYTGQYALLEKGGNNGAIDATTFGSYVNTSAGRLTGTTNWTAFASAKSTLSNNGVLPQTNDNPKSLDNDHLAQCEVLSGLPPEIQPYMGKTGRPFYDYYPWNVAANQTLNMTLTTNPPGNGNTRVAFPVQDGQTYADAELQGPSGIDFDDDGSVFVADTNHCQVLFKPGNSSSWQNWFPAGALSDPAYNWRNGNAKPDHPQADNRFYVFAGTLYPHAPNNDGVWSGADDSDSNNAGYNGRRRDIGNGSQPPNVAGGSVFVNPPQCPANGTTGGTIARGSAINRVQSATLGELGLYLANRNAFQQGANDNGQILFIPRVGLPNGTYWGITNPQPGRMYVICNFVDPQGMAVWRDPSATRRDVLFAPSMSLSANSVSKDRVLKLDSATMTPATTMNSPGVTMATGLSNPYDCALDDDGNLFIAENGNNELSMIAKVVPPDDGVYERTWGVNNPNAGQLYSIRTGLTSIASVTFAANDPQVPSGCLYIALGAAPANLPHRIIRMDETRAHQSVAGPAYNPAGAIPNIAMADSADSTPGNPVMGDAATTRLAIPWRARGDGNGTTYICDRGNNRIRKLESSSGSSQALGYLSLPYSTSAGAPLGKAIYNATLRLYSKANSGALTPPQVGLVSPFLKNGSPWSNATINANTSSFLPTLAPDVDLTVGRAQPSFPSTSGTWNFGLSPGGNNTPYYEWKLPAQLLFSSASDSRHQHLRLGMAPPADANHYYYPVSQGVVDPPYYKAPDFYTNNGANTGVNNDQRPRVDIQYGNLALTYPILSPPAIGYAGSTRYVYAMNSNALWRYNTTTPADFIGPNGAVDAFTRTAQGRAGGKGTLYTPGNTFMFNSTPPLITLDNQVFTVDTWAANAATFSYHVSALNGGLATNQTDMWQNKSAVLANNVAGSAADSAGIYMVAGDMYLTTAFMGLSNGRIYMIQLQ